MRPSSQQRQQQQRLSPRSLEPHQHPLVHNSFDTLSSPLPSFSPSFGHTSRLDKMLNLSFAQTPAPSVPPTVNNRSMDIAMHSGPSMESSIPMVEETRDDGVDVKRVPSLLTMVPPQPTHLPSSLSELLREWGVPSPVERTVIREESRQRQRSSPNNVAKWNEDVADTERYIHGEVARVRKQALRAIESIRHRLRYPNGRGRPLPSRHQLEAEVIYERIYGLLNDVTKCFRNISTLVEELNRLLAMQPPQPATKEHSYASEFHSGSHNRQDQQRHEPNHPHSITTNHTAMDLRFLQDLENRVREAWSTQASSPPRSHGARKYDDFDEQSAAFNEPVHHSNNQSMKAHGSNVTRTMDVSTATTIDQMPGDNTLRGDTLSVSQLLKRSEKNFRKLAKSLATTNAMLNTPSVHHKPLRVQPVPQQQQQQQRQPHQQKQHLVSSSTRRDNHLHSLQNDEILRKWL